MSTTPSPNQYVREHRETLANVIKHSDDDFTRALAIIALVKYGDDPDVEQVKTELAAAEEVVE